MQSPNLLICLATLAANLIAADPTRQIFDGKTFDGWTLADGAQVTHSWITEDGTLTTVASTTGRSDLLYTKPVRNFELTFEFRLSKGSNTGVKYFVSQTLRYLNPGSDGRSILEIEFED